MSKSTTQPFVIRQGDVLVRAVKEIPGAAAEIARKDDQSVLAYGEATGHHHSFFDVRVRMFRDDGLGRTFLRAEAAERRVRELERRQTLVMQWAVKCFGPVAMNRDERAGRLLEEATEVAQAEGLPPDIAERILHRVYSRPAGDTKQEIGGLAITLDALAENVGVSVWTEAQREYERITSLPVEWWQKKHAEKVAAGTADLSPPAPPLPEAPMVEKDTVAMTDDQIKHMVNRFLGWKLPSDFSPDAGISFKAAFNESTPHPMRHEPTGTNLFTSTQAEAMIRYLIEGLPHG